MEASTTSQATGSEIGAGHGRRTSKVQVRYELEFLAAEDSAEDVLHNVHELIRTIGKIQDEQVWISRSPDSKQKSTVTFFRPKGDGGSVMAMIG